MATRHCDCPAALIRAWARRTGHSVADRGELSWQIHDLYHEAFPRRPDPRDDGADGCEAPGDGAALETPSTAPAAETSEAPIVVVPVAAPSGDPPGATVPAAAGPDGLSPGATGLVPAS
ncbi:Lsr2 family DNA-binding protein [Cellulomonas triticagri]|uniref:Lsr2 DNA-binding domain-containing protein n=1 Tax=Cellulomonas triticagri TaxID=2483352 RepID=A0A3M2JPH2_9CELL|nr:hypothetical protein EBM89_01155 [Cellulomonas triticagri]